jgi:site-specific recombinase XerD
MASRPRDVEFDTPRIRFLGKKYAVYKAFRECLEATGLTGRGLTPHKLRHTCLTLLLDAGADLRTLQEIAGHSTVAVTQIYTHVSAKRLQEAMKLHPLG